MDRQPHESNGRTYLRDFDSIYKEFQPRILRYLGNLIGENDALDLTQTVFLKVSQSLINFRGESSLSTWIFRIATNSALDHVVSSESKQKGVEQLLNDDDSIDDFPHTGFPRSDQEYIRREMSSCKNNAGQIYLIHCSLESCVVFPAYATNRTTRIPESPPPYYPSRT